MKVLIFIVAYNAESHIERVLSRIPSHLWEQEHHTVEVLIIDDQSKDRTTITSKRYREEQGKLNLKVYSNPVNQGYGGNQKLGYHYAIEQGFDIVILLHGDGQYAPELLPNFIAAFSDPQIDAVFGSRMLTQGAARRGGMPLYKFVGNRVLTTVQNFLLGHRLSEFHSGYRAYRVSALRDIPFVYNSPDFDFDTDIIIQLVTAKKRIAEIPIPTYYGTEICHVNGIKYAIQILWSTVCSRLQRYSILYHPKFDISTGNTYYTLKLGQPSSHQWAIDASVGHRVVLDLGCGPGYLGAELRRGGHTVFGVDRHPQCAVALDKYISADLNHPLPDLTSLPDAPEIVLCLDIIEHLTAPEQFLLDLRAKLGQLDEIPDVVISTPNVAFAPIRFALLLGYFNYGKKGILDLTHTRLFTVRSLRACLRSTGYQIVRFRGIPPPLQMVFGSGAIGRTVTWLWWQWARAIPTVFAYQSFVVVRPQPTIERLLRESETHANSITDELQAR